MSALNFPLNPINGQQYPDPAIPGVNVYRYDSAANTWRLLGRAGSAIPGTYGDNTTCVEITIDASGTIQQIFDRPITLATNTAYGLSRPGPGLFVASGSGGTIELLPPIGSSIGGVKSGSNVAIASDGSVSVASATTLVPGIVQLNDTTSSSSTTQALTAAAGKALQDQITALAGSGLTFCGTYDASTSQMDYVTNEGGVKGFIVGDNLPTPTTQLNDSFVIVSVPGTPTSPAPVQPVGSGDWIVCDIAPVQWVVVPIGRFVVASQVIFNPYNYVTATDVQTAIQEVVNRTNLFSLASGTGLSGGPFTLAGGSQTINLLPPTATVIGGVKAGTNISIAADGTISVAGGGTIGSVTSVDSGTGLTGGPITTTGTLSISNTGVTAGTYSYPTFTVNAQGQITVASSNSTPVTSFTAGTGLTTTGSTGNITVSLGNTAVTAGSYTLASITVDAQGRITSASNGSAGVGSVTNVATGTGLIGGPITTTGTISLANTAVTPGSYTTANITVDAQGRITSAANGAGGVTQIVAGSNVTISPVGGTGVVTINSTGGGGGGGLTGLQEIDDISASFNGTTVAFPITISGSQPIPPGPGTGQLIVAIGGVVQTPGTAFTFDNATDTLTFTEAPLTGASFSGYVGGSAAPISDIVAGTGLSGGGTTGTVTLNLGNTAVTAGSYTLANITVDAQGRITSAANGTGGGGGTVTSVDVGGGTTGLTFTGGPITTNGLLILGGVLGVANGGTGATTQTGSANAILPSQGGNNGRFLQTNGTNSNWSTAVTSVDTGTGLTGGTITTTGTISLANTAVAAGSYTLANITVDAQGRITSASSGTAGLGSVTNVATGTGLTGGPVTTTGTISLADTAVTPGAYNFANITVDAQGRLTAASAGNPVTTVTAGAGLSGGGVGGSLTLDVGAGTGITVGADSISLANTTVSAGSYTTANITVDAQGRITAASNGAGGVTQIVAGSNVTITPASGVGAVTINATGGGGGGGLTGLQEIDDITSQFNGTAVTFLLQIAGSNLPAGTSPSQLIIFIANNVQNPGQSFTFDSATSQITFTTAPTSGQQFIGFVGGSAAPITNVVAGTGLTGGGLSGAVTLNLGNTAVTAGTYTAANITVDAQGRITSAANGVNGTVTSVATGTGLTGGPVTSTGTISLANTAVTPGTYNYSTITVDQQGRLTSAATGSPVTNVATGTGLTGGPITTTGTISLADTAVTPGSYTLANITVDAQGRITAAANGTAGGTGTVTSVATGTGLTGGPVTSTGTIALADTVVTPGSYNFATLTVDQQGRLTAASTGVPVTSVTAGTGLSGGTITSTGTIAISNTTVTAGSYTNANLTVNAQGQITSAANGADQAYHYATLDDISAGFNGTATTFNLTIGTVAYTPNPVSNIMVFVGGIAQIPTTAYTISGSQITFTEAPLANATFYATTVRSA